MGVSYAQGIRARLDMRVPPNPRGRGFGGTGLVACQGTYTISMLPGKMRDRVVRFPGSETLPILGGELFTDGGRAHRHLVPIELRLHEGVRVPVDAVQAGHRVVDGVGGEVLSGWLRKVFQ